MSLDWYAVAINNLWVLCYVSCSFMRFYNKKWTQKSTRELNIACVSFTLRFLSHLKTPLLLHGYREKGSTRYIASAPNPKMISPSWIRWCGYYTGHQGSMQTMYKYCTVRSLSTEAEHFLWFAIFFKLIR